MKKKSPRIIESRWPAELDSIPGIIEHVQSRLAASGMDKKTAAQMGLVMEELTVNIINYAYDNPVGKEIRIDIEKKSDAVVIHITDTGMAFDCTKTAPPDIDLPLEERGIGGLGIFFVRQMVDDISYQRANGENRLTLVKHL